MTFLSSLSDWCKCVFLGVSCLIIALLVLPASGQAGVYERSTVVPAAEIPVLSHAEAASEEDGVQSVTAALRVPAERITETQPRSLPPLAFATDDDAGPALKPHGNLDLEPESSRSRFLPTSEDKEFGPAPDSGWRPIMLPRRFQGNDDMEGAETASDSQNGVSNKFHWKPAVLQSIMIQGFQHAYAIVIQEKTRRGLKGPFFKDYIDSVKNLHGWDDGNRFFTNYIAHPMQGAMTGFIFLQNHDRLKRQKFAESKTYWADRLKAMLWSAAWSTQWEIGPMSQASIGNVGKEKGMAYVDLVMTPTVGTGWMVVEEALDRYVIRHFEGRSNFLRMVLRTILNPMRGVANLLRFKTPWYRDRPVGH